MLMVVLFFFVFGCEQTFEPLQKSDDYYFSIYGYLDASADTQWVRVIPLREGIDQLPDVSGVTVTLQHLETGDSVVMRDTLFQFFHDASAWNFWTSLDLLPEHTYRLIAEHTDGRSSSVEVTLPTEFSVPVFDEQSGILRVFDVELLADVQTRYIVRFEQLGRDYTVSFPYRQNISPYSSTEYRVLLRPGADQAYLDEYYAGGTILSRQIFVAAAGPGWPDFIALDEIIETLPDGISNVENGVGYMAGIMSMLIPLKSCYDETGNLIGCPVE